MDPRFRGRSLGPDRLRKSMTFLLGIAWPHLMGETPVPPLEEFMAYQSLSGKNLSGKTWLEKSVGPITFCSLFQDSPLHFFGKCVAMLPASEASVERVFSALSFAADQRERVTIEHLEREAYIR